MNHLCGIQNNNNDEDSTSSRTMQSLTEDEQRTLDSFKKKYESCRPTDYYQPNKKANPTYLLHSTTSDDLPPCGWRPLDDSTLYRFLCADRHNDNEFQMEKSLNRLQRALKFRKEQRCDEMIKHELIKQNLSYMLGEEEEEEEDNDDQDSLVTFSASEEDEVVVPSSPRSVRSYITMASGTLSECGTIVETVEIKPKKKQQDSSTMKKNRSRCDTGNSTTSTCTASSIGSESSITIGGTMAAKMSPLPFTDEELAKYQRLRVRVFTGRDKDGHPVMFERLGEFLGSGNCSRFTEEQWIQFYVWDLERHFIEMKKASADHPNQVIDSYIFVGDATGIVSAILNRSLWKAIPLLKALVASVEDFYPEIAFKIILVNVPKAASAAYKVVKGFLDPVTASKINMYSSFPLEEIKQFIPLDSIPKEYGGTSAVPYPKTSTK